MDKPSNSRLYLLEHFPRVKHDLTYTTKILNDVHVSLIDLINVPLQVDSQKSGVKTSILRQINS